MNSGPQRALCRTMGRYNGCGSDCVTHFLVYKILTNQIQQKNQDPAYQALLATFQQHYKLEKLPTWAHLKSLLERYPAPTDREGISSLVLRKYLGETLSIGTNPATFWEFHGTVAFDQYVIDGIAVDALEADRSPAFKANKPFFDNLRKKFLEGTAVEPLREEARQYWLKEGAVNYGTYIADFSKQEPISADQLNLLCQRLSITLRINPLINLSMTGQEWELNLFNDGAHWEFEEFTNNANLAQNHNRYYAEFEINISGKFNLWGEGAAASEEEIIEAVKKESHAIHTMMEPMNSAAPNVKPGIPSVNSETPSIKPVSSHNFFHLMGITVSALLVYFSNMPTAILAKLGFSSAFFPPLLSLTLVIGGYICISSIYRHYFAAPTISQIIPPAPPQKTEADPKLSHSNYLLHNFTQESATRIKTFPLTAKKTEKNDRSFQQLDDAKQPIYKSISR